MAIRKGTYSVNVSQNGMKYVELSSISGSLHISEGNSKVGKRVMCYNLPIHYTCDHRCECYKNKVCYACSGCYLFSSNQAKYAENLRFFMEAKSSDFVQAVNAKIKAHKSCNLFRWFTCGNIPSYRFLDCMVEIARNNPGVKFWSYTKKYGIVNRWIDENGLDALPENLVIIFSHWLNDGGSYFPMNNKYNMPTSEFIPLGMESKAETVTHICPCSDPTVKANCETCDHACYTLKRGESTALLEHSTSRTKERDRAVKAAHDAL